MPKAIKIVYLILFLLTTGLSSVRAEEALPDKLQKLTDEAYRSYSARETDSYFEAVKKVKDATEFSQYQETYYRACSYEAIYMFEYVDRKKGVQLAHDIYHHAKSNNSNVGMYFATFALGTIREQSGNMGLAEKSFLQALKLKEKYLPEESAAPCYLGLCEVALHRKDYEEVKEYARLALNEPGIIPMNQITACSYKCLARYNQRDSLGFEKAYKERAQLIAEHGGQGGLFGELINVYQAKNRKQWQLALQRAEKLIHQQNKCAQKASIYEHMGDYRQALYWQKRTRAVIDSIQSSEARSQMNEFDTELSITYAENETKEQELAKEQTMLWAGGTIAILLIAFLAIYGYRCNKHTKRMKSVNSKLQHAYDQLEVTTAAKERIESELRIARDIQKSMVPSVFPQREGLDMYASMTPAKEVGGDLYGYLLEGDKLYFCLGDVSGKGVPASLFMAQATRLFHTLAKQGMMPAEICTRMNEALSGEDNESGMFVTFFLGLANLTTGHLDYCNAGHNPPVIGGCASGGDFLDVLPNAPIGLWPGLEYEGEQLDSIKGRPMFLYTDGLNEAEDTQQAQFGDDRLLDILRHTPFDNARHVIEHLGEAVEQHRKGAEPNDDLTMLCLRID